MGKEELIDCFKDTLNISRNVNFEEKTLRAIKSNRVYNEGFISNASYLNKASSIIVEAKSSFESARQYCSLGKVAVLNFANPEYPGGGVHLGAMAQEECLCRSSNLYCCISHENVFNDYYLYHRGVKNSFYTDRLIYTSGVTVFKNDNVVPQILAEEEWFTVDIITCAAPYLAKRKYTNIEALLVLFKKRIKNIFEAARDNRVDVIILGAFGCGAFKNPPIVVAEAFRQVICEQNYFKAFKQIVFAIKPTSQDCPNLNAFLRQFDCYAPYARNKCLTLPQDLSERFRRIPAFLKDKLSVSEQEFYSWQINNKYYGKQFSILGDSLSTLAGYNPRGYKVFYAGENSEKTGVIQREDTWWDNVISYFGGELLINNSWSGSRVTKLPDSEELFPSGCSDERTSSLHINEIKPDVIIVYLGTNDWAFGAKTAIETRFLHDEDEDIFDLAYDRMLKKLKENYPQSEIWCCVLSETYISKRPDFVFPHKHAGTHIEEYNQIIRECVQKNSCKLIDLYSYKVPYDSVDGSHPTSAGMNTIAKMVIRSIAEQKINLFKCDILFEQKQNQKSEYVTLSSSIEDFIGKKVNGKYIILALLDDIGVFKTFLVMDEISKRQLAMKVYDKNNNNYSQVIRDSILQESYMMMKLQHLTIPVVVDVIEDENSIFIIREYVEGERLDILLRNYGSVEVETVIMWMKELCDALGYLHKQNPSYILQNMKPANIIVQPDGLNIKLVNCTDINVYSALKEFDACCLGTRGYVAPEVERGQIDTRSNIYSFGMIMYYLLTGIDPEQPPFMAKPIRAINPNLPLELEEIILRCTQFNPNERFQSYDELMVALQGGLIYPMKKKRLFDNILRRHIKPKFNSSVKKIYSSMNKEYREKVFYGNIVSADNILTWLTRAVFGRITDENVDICFQIYLQTWILSRAGLNINFSTSSYIESALCEKFFYIDADVVSKCVEYSLCEIYKHEPALKQLLETFEAIEKNIFNNVEKNKNIEDIYINDPDYGLIADKPIFVDGFGSDREYLTHLYTSNGTKLAFERLGSLEVQGIAGPVDMYAMLLPDNTEYTRIFICNYGSRMKRNVPLNIKYIN